MTDKPSEGDQPNPFKGTPFEQLFAAFGGGGGLPGAGGMPGFGVGGAGMPDLSLLMSQVQAMMQPHAGAVNWTLARDVARRTSAQQPDPSVPSSESAAIADALRLADHWLDSATELPSGVSSTVGWSRAEWVEQTMPVWQQLVEPVAEHVVTALTKAIPEETRTMAGPLIGLLNQAGGAMFGSQVGQAIGGLAGEVLSSTDVGLPLARTGQSALLPANVATFASGLDVPAEDVRLYIALREAAHQRLFAHVPWLASHLLAAVEDYGRGTTIDISKIESQLSGFDPTNPAALQEALEGGLFEPEKTPTQQAALARLETLLALVEGWVDEVVTQATTQRMPNAARLQEVVRRRRAAGGPAEVAFAALVGLELRPRRLRDASALWGNLRARDGATARDAVWAHPDLLPTAADLDDPLGFGEQPVELDMADADFDAALAELLDGPAPKPSADETRPSTTPEPEEGDGPSDDRRE
jgi:putative hydrolase